MAFDLLIKGGNVIDPAAGVEGAQGCQDHALGLAIEQSARTGSDVKVEREVWA